MNKNILVLIFVFVFFILFPLKSHAARIIFSDNFDTGVAEKWIPSTGNWIVREGKYGAVANNPSQNAMSLANLDITTPNYTIELDMYPIRGIDRTIRFRFESNINVYDIHFTSDGIATSFGMESKTFILGNHPFEENKAYHIKVELNDKHLKFFIDGELIFDKVDDRYIFDGHEKFGLLVATGSVPTEVYFDNIVINTDSGLNVPLLKQTDPAWADDIYDSAGLWTTKSPTIARWGCAITSAAMVLNYHKVNKLPDGTQLDPGSLNAYLKSVPDGYVRNGLTNWQAIAVMAKSAKPQNPEFVYDSFEFGWGSNDVSALQADIDAGVPSILEVGMPGGGSHFVVATGVDEGAVAINDPGFDRSDLTEYGSDFLSTRRFIPSNTDLSYMMFVVDPNVNILLKDEMGNVVGSPILEKPIEDPLGLLTNSMGPLKVVHFGKPSTGNYKIEISSSSTQSYHLDGYLYDELGGLKMMVSKGLVGENSADRLNIHFDKSDINLSFVDNSQNSVPSLIEDLEHLKELGHFKNNGSYNSIKSILKNVERMNGKNSAKLLSNLKQQLADGGKDGVDEFARQYLIAKIDLILSS